MLDTLINEEIFKNLPTMPEVIMKVINMLQSDSTPNMLLADAIAHDPAMSARIFALVNSPAYGTRNKPTKLVQAIGVLGRKMVKTVALECSIKSVTPQSGGFGKLMWENAIGCAVCARMIALETKLFDHEEAFIAGMLCPIGKTALAKHFGNGYQVLLELCATSRKDLSLVEIERFGFTNELVGAAILKNWNLDQCLVEAVLHHRDLKDLTPNSNETVLARILNISAIFCEKSGIGQLAKNENIDLTKILAAFMLHIKPEQMQDLFDQFLQTYENDRDYYLS